MRLLRILWLPTDEGGCGWHRVRIWDKAINRLGIAESLVMQPGESEEDAKKAIDYADVIVGRLNTFEYIRLIKQTWPNKVVVFDWDDNTLETKPSNPSYQNFGVRDVWAEVKDVRETDYYKKASIGTRMKIDEMGMIPLWVTGITPGFNRFVNLEQHTNLIWCLQACNLATSPTPVLTAMWDKYAEQSAVVSNCLDLSYYPDVEVKLKREKGEIRIGWSGGSSHSADWKSIMPTLRKLAKKHPIKLVVAGSYFPENFTDIEIEHHPWAKWEAHPYRMKLLDLDFALIPLADDESFNSYKSELKMMEFAALKVPMIVKDQLPYSPYIEGNAIGYKTPQDLEGAIERLIKNPGQKDMVKSAYKWVSEKRNVDLLAPDLIKLYASLLPEKTREKIQVEPAEESK